MIYWKGSKTKGSINVMTQVKHSPVTWLITCKLAQSIITMAFHFSSISVFARPGIISDQVCVVDVVMEEMLREHPDQITPHVKHHHKL